MDEIDIRMDEAPDGVQVVHLTGPLTVRTVFDFQDVVRNRKPRTGRIVALSGVPYMDSAGLGVILEAFASAQRHSLRFALSDVTERVLTVLRVARVDSLLPHFDSVESARQHVVEGAKG